MQQIEISGPARKRYMRGACIPSPSMRGTVPLQVFQCLLAIDAVLHGCKKLVELFD